jgi:hypothetical protein
VKTGDQGTTARQCVLIHVVELARSVDVSIDRSSEVVADEDMRPYAITLWVLGLFVLCVTCTAMMFAAAGASEHWQEHIIYGLGGGIPLFLATTLGWIVGYLVTRNMKKALWTWTALILVASALLAIGVFCTQPSTLFTTRTRARRHADGQL